jgi:hypothetical protein
MRPRTGTWDLARMLRLGLAVAFLVAATSGGGTVAYVLAAVLGMQAIFNVGCCGATCDPRPRQARDVNREREITFEKVE